MTEIKRLAANIFNLALLQTANYILPLITLPYLARVLGPEYFGLLAFATATIGYFALVSDYGFNLTATQQISIHRKNQEKVVDIFSSVMIIKMLLMIACFFVLMTLVFIIPRFSNNWQLYLVAYGIVVGQVMFPTWFFQGMEEMKYIAFLNIISKSVFTACIFLFVNNPSDYILVPLFTTFGAVLGAAVSLYVVRYKYNVKFKVQNYDNILLQIKEGGHVFFSNIAISLYTISITFVLGLFTNNVVVGEFSVADRIIQAAKGIYQPVAQAIYPYIGKKLHDNTISGLKMIRRITKIVGAFMFVLSALIYYFANELVDLLVGGQYPGAITSLQIMAPLPLVIALSNIYGIQTMVNLGRKEAFLQILSSAAIMGLVLSIFLVPNYQSNGSAITLLIVESFVTVVMFVYLKNYLRNKT